MKKKFNKFDLVIVLVIVALIAGTVLRFTVLNKSTGVATANDTQITYTLRIIGLRQYTLDMLQPGDVIYSATTKTPVGTIADISYTDAQTLMDTQDGRLIWGTWEGRFDAVLTVEVNGSLQDGAYRVDTYNLMVNKSAEYYTKYSSFSATILSVE